VTLSFANTIRSPCISRYKTRKLFGEGSFWALVVPAEEPLDEQMQDDCPLSPRQVGRKTRVGAVNVGAFSPAYWAVSPFGRAFDLEPYLVASDRNLLDNELICAQQKMT
jgi:hypothetical protein